VNREDSKIADGREEEGGRGAAQNEMQRGESMHACTCRARNENKMKMKRKGNGKIEK